MGSCCNNNSGPSQAELKKAETEGQMSQFDAFIDLMEQNHQKDQDLEWLFDLIDINEKINKRIISKPLKWVTEPNTVASYAICYMYLYLSNAEVIRNQYNRQILQDKKIIYRLLANCVSEAQDIRETSLCLIGILSNSGYNGYVLDALWIPGHLSMLFGLLDEKIEGQRILVSRIIRNCYFNSDRRQKQIQPFMGSYVQILTEFKSPKNCLEHMINLRDFFFIYDIINFEYLEYLQGKCLLEIIGNIRYSQFTNIKPSNTEWKEINEIKQIMRKTKGDVNKSLWNFSKLIGNQNAKQLRKARTT